MADAHIATAADYADAMLTARKAKHWLFLLLLLILVIQLAAFFVGAYTDLVYGDADATVPTVALAQAAQPPTTAALGDPSTRVSTPAGTIEVEVPDRTGDAEPTGPTDRPDIDTGTSPETSDKIHAVLRYVIGLTDFLGIALVIVLSWVLLLIVLIMLVGRLIGVSRLTSAFIWTLVLAVLLFPWQAFLERSDFKIPGVLYTWDEYNHPTEGAQFVRRDLPVETQVLKWARFVAFPAAALVLLCVVQVKSNRGLRQALGEAALDTDEGAPIV